MTKSLLLAFAALLLMAVSHASAQVDVNISFRRSLYLKYEPIICTVSITNRSGRELTLSDTEKEKWFGFQITTIDGRPLPPVNGDYRNEPVQIGSGQTLKRQVNLAPLYPLSEFGTYRVQAVVYLPDLKRFFSSPNLNVEITEGRLLWQETVGVPAGVPGGPTRTIALLAHRLPASTMLYIRIQDKDAGLVYCTHQLGRFIGFNNRDVQLDKLNHVHVIQNIAPKAFLYSEIGLNGEVLKRQAYQEQKDRPFLARNGDGEVTVVGGLEYDPNAPSQEKQLPKISDRPVPLPTPSKKPPAEDKRPENLLSQ